MNTAALTHDVKAAPPARRGVKSMPISRPGDRYEQEAEQVARDAVSGSGAGPAWSLSKVGIAAPLQRECSCGGTCDDCKKKPEQTIQRATAAGATASPLIAPPEVHDVLGGAGSPLDHSTRSFMESRLRHDFSSVRIFHDHAAAASAKSVAANAYTVGNKIVFDRGHYKPETLQGRQLLAHELTHVVQQSGVKEAAGPIRMGRVGDAHEAQARTHASMLQTDPSSRKKLSIHRLTQRTVQRYEAGEHAQFGNTGEDVAPPAPAPSLLTYKVKAGELPKQIAAKFKVTEEALRSANAGKVKHWPSNADPSVKVTGFNAGEVINIPPVATAATKPAIQTGELTININGVALPYGEGIAFGDFFETPEEMLAAPASELQALSALIKRERAGEKVTDEERDAATPGHRYIHLAEKNESHFAPSNSDYAPPTGKSAGDHKATWETHHKQALTESQGGDKEKALATNSFADHFLTDAFSAGHLINKRDVMDKFEGNLPKAPSGTEFTAGSKTFFNSIATSAYTGAVKTEFSKTKTVACFSAFGSHPEAPCSDTLTVHAGIDDADTFSKLLQGIHMKEPILFESVIAKGVHDNLNAAGVPVENQKGDKWTLSGDNSLNAETLKVGKKAVAQSQRNVTGVFKMFGPLDFPGLFKAVWDFVPRATAGAGVKQVKDAVDTGTDVTQASVVSAAVALVRKNLKLIVEELITRKILMRK